MGPIGEYNLHHLPTNLYNLSSPGFLVSSRHGGLSISNFKLRWKFKSNLRHLSLALPATSAGPLNTQGLWSLLALGVLYF